MPMPRPAPGTGRWWLVGVVGVVLGTAFIVWYGVTTTVGRIGADVTAYRIVGPSSVVVEYDVHRPAGTPLRCVVTALDERHGRVGTVSDDVPASEATSVHRVVTVRTSTLAVTGVVDSCVRVGTGS